MYKSTYTRHLIRNVKKVKSHSNLLHQKKKVVLFIFIFQYIFQKRFLELF